MKEDFCNKLSEMEYVCSEPSKCDSDKDYKLLAIGSYKGFEFEVLNIRGTHPCAYVNVVGTQFEGKDYDDIDGIDCHGGLTYARDHLLDGNDCGWWIGWDYAHYGDYEPRYCYSGAKHTTDECVADCKCVIDQIRNLQCKDQTKHETN